MEKNVEYKGTPIVDGIVIAPLIVVDEAIIVSNINDIEGKIAVIKRATPNIVLWLRKAVGLVVEKGGITSHGAVLAREFNVPAIVGINNIYNNIKAGMLGELRSGEGILKVWYNE